MRRLCCIMLAVSLCLALCGCNSYTIVVTDKDFQFPNNEMYSRTMRFMCDPSVDAEIDSVGSFITTRPHLRSAVRKLMRGFLNLIHFINILPNKAAWDIPIAPSTI